MLSPLRRRSASWTSPASSAAAVFGYTNDAATGLVDRELVRVAWPGSSIGTSGDRKRHVLFVSVANVTSCSLQRLSSSSFEGRPRLRTQLCGPSVITDLTPHAKMVIANGPCFGTSLLRLPSRSPRRNSKRRVCTCSESLSDGTFRVWWSRGAENPSRGCLPRRLHPSTRGGYSEGRLSLPRASI